MTNLELLTYMLETDREEVPQIPMDDVLARLVTIFEKLRIG